MLGTPVTPVGGGPRMLRLQFRGEAYDWLDLGQFQASVSSPEEYFPTVQDNIAYYFKVPQQFQVFSDEDGPVATAADFRRLLKSGGPLLRLADAREARSDDRRATVQALDKLIGELMQKRDAIVNAPEYPEAPPTPSRPAPTQPLLPPAAWPAPHPATATSWPQPAQAEPVSLPPPAPPQLQPGRQVVTTLPPWAPPAPQPGSLTPPVQQLLPQQPEPGRLPPTSQPSLAPLPPPAQPPASRPLQAAQPLAPQPAAPLQPSGPSGQLYPGPTGQTQMPGQGGSLQLPISIQPPISMQPPAVLQLPSSPGPAVLPPVERAPLQPAQPWTGAATPPTTPPAQWQPGQVVQHQQQQPPPPVMLHSPGPATPRRTEPQPQPAAATPHGLNMPVPLLMGQGPPAAAPGAVMWQTEPVARQLVAEPVARQLVAEPVARQAVAEPVARQMVAEPIAGRQPSWMPPSALTPPMPAAPTPPPREAGTPMREQPWIPREPVVPSAGGAFPAPSPAVSSTAPAWEPRASHVGAIRREERRDSNLTEVTLQKTDDSERYGFQIKPHGDGNALICYIDPTGILARWNWAYPRQAVREGDLIVQVNGANGRGEDLEAMKKEMNSTGISMLVRRGQIVL